LVIPTQGNYCGSTPASNQTPDSYLLTPLQWDGGAKRKGNTEKSHGLRYSLTGKAKAVYTSIENQEINSLLPIGRKVFSHVQGGRAPSHLRVIWEDKGHHSKSPTLLSSPPPALCAEHDVQNISVVSWGQLSQLCPLPAPRAPPVHSLVGW